MLIRPEVDDDRGDVFAIHASAFPTRSEAELVDALREEANPIISLVAVGNDKIVGHIFFSPVSLSDHPHLEIMGLAPMAVIPEHQRKEIGSALVRAGLEQCRQSGFDAVVVLGHPEYYPRFGFSPSTRFGIESEYEVPEEVFMAMELRSTVLSEKSGTVRYHSAFSNL